MPNQSLETLGDFVRRVRWEKNLSCEAVSQRSARFGPPIAGSYVNRIENNPHLRPSVDRLRALAHGLNIPIEELLARAAGLVPSDSDSNDAFRLVARFRALPPQRKADILQIVDLWYSQGE
jgi:transcriptional regulator with XRE-family HTH domain